MEPLDEMEEVMQTPKNNVKKTRSHTTNKKATTNKRATSSRSRNTKVEGISNFSLHHKYLINILKFNQ